VKGGLGLGVWDMAVTGGARMGDAAMTGGVRKVPPA